MRVVVEIVRHQRLVRVAENALQCSVSRLSDRSIHLASIRGARRLEHQVDNRDIGCRNPDRDAVKLAVELGQDQADGLGRSRRGRDHAQCGGPGAVKVLVHRIQGRLIARIGVDRGHEALGDADRIVQDLGNR